MQKEDLIKRMRLWAVAITSTFAVVIVALVCQFAVIAYNAQLKADMERQNALKQQQINYAQQDQNYWENQGKDDHLQNEYGVQ
jgi:anaerobic C4-dicarboxylate transporter